MEFLKDYITSKYFKLGLIGTVFILFSISFAIGRCTSPEPKEILRVDTVKTVIEKPALTLGVKKEEPPQRPLPAVTTFKISDWVCAWDRWSGVVINIKWSEKSPTLLLYNIQTYSDEDGWNSENWYYESELKAGKCN